MPELTHQQKNTSKQTNFKLSFREFPGLVYMARSVDLPGVAIATTEIPTGLAPVMEPSTKLDYEQIPIEFLVSEDLSNWEEIHNWMRGLTSAKSIGDNAILLERLLGAGKKKTDMSIILLNNVGAPVVEYTFIDAWPVNLSSINYRADLTEATDVTATASFVYDYFEVKRHAE